MKDVIPPNQPAGEDPTSLLYDLYTALAREFAIDLPSGQESDLEIGYNSAQATLGDKWFLEADERIAVHQLRQFLQTSSLAAPQSLRAVLEHHLHKAPHGEADRDKLDFLLVQYLSVCSPFAIQDAEVSLAFVASILAPVLGPCDQDLPKSVEPLEGLVQAANACLSLREVFSSGILEKGRKLKAASGDDYFTPSALVAFARFNFSMRRAFFRLMHEDLNAILDGLRELELRGIETLDCRRAEFSANEPVARLRMICQSWKVMFQAEYSFGQPVRILADLRAVMDAAFENGQPSASTDSPAARARAAAASAEVGETASPAQTDGDELDIDIND